MTFDEINQRVAVIRGIIADDRYPGPWVEEIHLWKEFIAYVASGKWDITVSAKAMAVLTAALPDEEKRKKIVDELLKRYQTP